MPARLLSIFKVDLSPMRTTPSPQSAAQSNATLIQEPESGSPVRTIEPHTPVLVNSLSKLFPGMDFHNLYAGLHALFGQGRVVLAGSTAKALFALQMKGNTAGFRKPNDIDLIVSAVHLELAPLHNQGRLAEFGLTIADPAKPHVLRYKDGNQSLKIDLVPSTNAIFKRAFDDTEFIEGMPVTKLSTLCELDRIRLRNSEGNTEQIEGDIEYFRPLVPATHGEAPANAVRPQPKGRVCRTLF